MKSHEWSLTSMNTRTVSCMREKENWDWWMLNGRVWERCLCYDGWRSVVVRPSLSGSVRKGELFFQLIFWYDLVFFQSCTVILNESRIRHQALKKITVDKLLDVGMVLDDKFPRLIERGIRKNSWKFTQIGSEILTLVTLVTTFETFSLWITSWITILLSVSQP